MSSSTTIPPQPQPQPQPGRIILLNGCSSSGKSTLARSLQLALPTPFLILSSDMLVDGGCLPPQRIYPSSSPSTSLSPTPRSPFNWPHTMRPKFFTGFHGCIAAMARAGNDLIVDHVVEYALWWAELDVLLAGLDVWVVGVHCEIEEVERRERARGDRFVGEGRAHLERNGIHGLVAGRGGYGFEVDMTVGVGGGAVGWLIDAWGRTEGTGVVFDA